MSVLAELERKSRRANRLFSVLLELTYACNLNCFLCYNDDRRAGTPLTRQQYFQLLEDLGAMGVMNLVLSGGEPLAHPDFFAIGRKARQLGFVIRVKSNGHALREPLARRLKDEVDPFAIDISIHGARAETHDRQTRTPGSFDRLLSNLATLRDLGLRVKLACPLTQWNEVEIEALHRLAERFGLLLQMSAEITPCDDGDPTPLSIAPSAGGVRRLIEWQLSRKPAQPAESTESTKSAPEPRSAFQPGDKLCGAGSSTAAVDPFGNVYPCVQWRRAAGNLHQQAIAAIWADSAALRRTRALTAAALQVAQDDHRQTPHAPFCPALAEILTGSATTVYPAAQRQARLLKQLIEQRDPPS